MQFENNIVCVSMFWKYFFFHTELLKVWISFSQVLGNQPSEGKVSTFSECLQTCNCSLWRTPTNTYSSIEILYYKYILLYWAVLLKNKWYIILCSIKWQGFFILFFELKGPIAAHVVQQYVLLVMW